VQDGAAEQRWRVRIYPVHEVPDAIARPIRSTGTKGGCFMTSATYRVTGMTCEHCVHAVASELKMLDGVGDVTIDLYPSGISTVTVTSDGPLARQAVVDALDEAGDYQLARS
jgi:copper chaperone